MRITLLLIYSISIFSIAHSGSKKFSHEEAMEFENMWGRNITNNGLFVSYYSGPDRGDGKLHLHNLKSGDYIFFERGSSLRYDDETKVFAFLEKPKKIESENASKNKPKNILKLYYPEWSTFKTVGQAKSFTLSSNGHWAIYRGYDKNKNPDKKSHKKFGTKLNLHHIESGTEIILDDVIDFALDSTSHYLAYTVSGKDEARDGIYIRDMTAPFIPEETIEKDSNALYHHLKWHDKSLTLAYLKAEADSNGYNDFNSLYIFGPGRDKSVLKVPAEQERNGITWHIKDDTPAFSEDGQRIFYSTRPAWRIIHNDDEDDDWNDSTYYDFDRILKDRKLNVWHWNDPNIMTVQQTNWRDTKRESFLAVYNLDNNKYFQLADTNMQSPSGIAHSPRYLTLRDYNKYAKHVTWYGWFYDLLLSDINTGQSEIIADSLENGSHLSPDGKYVTWFKNGHWYLYDTKNKDSKNISENSSEIFQNQEEDRPGKNSEYGFMGWEEKTGYPIYYTKHDAIRYNIISQEFENITSKIRGEANLRYRYADLDRQDPWIDTKDAMIFYVWDYSKKSTALHLYEPALAKVTHKLGGEYNYRIGDIAKDSDKIIYTRENYRTFPEVSIASKSLTDTSTVSKLQPYYLDDYNWGTAHQVNWLAQNGDTLYGTYILPDNYDPNNKYPVFIYYYEKFGDRHNNWVQPVVNHRPNYQTFVSDGYIMFLPDIYFREGDPGPSSTESMMDAMAALEKAASIDEEKVVLHGHSWSGYQSAYIGTQTDYFAAIVTGAPVSNMTSAYSGIRLGSGLARQFQYERGQSRIGGNLIDSLDAYIRNSPVFFADKMNTPMLIQFGDIDDAVPYSQGVELYLALRRFQKPAIMLQYEGEPHHLKQYANKLDYLIKMKEFSDYWIGRLDEMPEWIEKGVPYWGK